MMFFFDLVFCVITFQAPEDEHDALVRRVIAEDDEAIRHIFEPETAAAPTSEASAAASGATSSVLSEAAPSESPEPR